MNTIVIIGIWVLVLSVFFIAAYTSMRPQIHQAIDDYRKAKADRLERKKIKEVEQIGKSN